MRIDMNQRYRLFRRGWGTYYAEDQVTKKQESLKTKDKHEAQRLVAAKNENEAAPAFSRHLARVYWKAGDPDAGKRDWQFVMEQMLSTKKGETQRRLATAIKDKALDPIRNRVILETSAEHLLAVLKNGTVYTNTFLRRFHNFALDMGWLPWPIIPKKQWPPVKFRSKRAITSAEHQRIINREGNPERRAFYEVAWHMGASQTDIANLESDNIDWKNKIITYSRAKTGEIASVRFGAELAEVIKKLPSEGPLFPYLRSVRPGDRATEFKQRCVGLGIEGVTLHSYRYAWAERAKTAGYPERFAQQALGHNSKAVHRAYAKKAHVILPALSEYEQREEGGKVIEMNAKAAEPDAPRKRSVG